MIAEKLNIKFDIKRIQNYFNKYVKHLDPVKQNEMFGGWSSSNSSGSGNIVASTVKRVALPTEGYVETDYYTDNVGMIQNKTVLLAGLKNFYHKTGVQPYVYIVSSYGDSASLEDYTKNLYDQLFKDDRHFLVVFLYDKGEDKITGFKYVVGTAANAIIDQEAQDIFNGYLDRYYYDNSLTYEQFFSKSFNDTAEHIMSVTTSPWIPVLIVLGVLLVLVLIFVWWRKAKKQKNIEAKQTEDMLKTPLHKFEDSEEDEAEKRARNYDGDPDNDVK